MPDGRHIGCLCQHPAARTRGGYYLHLGDLADMLVQETLDAAFVDHRREHAHV